MKLISVKYHSQRNNTKFKIKPCFPIKKYPRTSCFTTVLNMVLSFCGIQKNDEDLLNDFESKWFKALFKQKYGSVSWMMSFFYKNNLRYLWKAEQLLGNTYLKKVGKRLVYKGFSNWTEFEDKVIEEIDNDRPVIVGLKKRVNGKKFGHIVLIVGYDDEGFIFNDPYGDWVSVYKEHYGYSVFYSFQYMESALHIDRMLVLEDL